MEKCLTYVNLLWKYSRIVEQVANFFEPAWIFENMTVDLQIFTKSESLLT